MPDQEIENKVKQIIVDELGVDENEVTPNARFIDDLGADSLDTVELVMRFEEEFGIEIPDEDAEKIQSVRDALVRQVSAPVRWVESMELLRQQGVETFVEAGPGKVLSGLMRQISRDVKTLNVEDAASLEATRTALAAGN